MKGWEKSTILLNAIIPILFYCILYIFFRSDNLNFFYFFNELDIAKYILCIKGVTNCLLKYIPEWVIFSLPFALWSYSLTFFFSVFFQGHYKTRLAVCALTMFVSILVEVLQYGELISGVYSDEDLIALLFFHIVFLLFHVKPKKNKVEFNYLSSCFFAMITLFIYIFLAIGAFPQKLICCYS